MDQNLPRWNQPGWQYRLVLAEHHRQQRSIFEYPGTWSGLDWRLRPRTPVAWNLSLHALAASAMPDLVEIALKRGALPTAPLQILAIGVEAGNLVEFKTPTAAYFWDKQYHRRFDERTVIRTPVEAALAGGCEDSLGQIIAKAGGLDDATTDQLTAWILSMPIDNPRIEAGSLLCEYLVRERRTASAAQFGDWLKRAQKFIDRTYRRPVAMTKPFARTLRRLNRVCAELQIDMTLPPNLTAQLL
jgi:hypothetical protein